MDKQDLEEIRNKYFAIEEPFQSPKFQVENSPAEQSEPHYLEEFSKYQRLLKPAIWLQLHDWAQDRTLPRYAMNVISRWCYYHPEVMGKLDASHIATLATDQAIFELNILDSPYYQMLLENGATKMEILEYGEHIDWNYYLLTDPCISSPMMSNALQAKNNRNERIRKEIDEEPSTMIDKMSWILKAVEEIGFKEYTSTSNVIRPTTDLVDIRERFKNDPQFLLALKQKLDEDIQEVETNNEKSNLTEEEKSKMISDFIVYLERKTSIEDIYIYFYMRKDKENCQKIWTEYITSDKEYIKKEVQANADWIAKDEKAYEDPENNRSLIFSTPKFKKFLDTCLDVSSLRAREIMFEMVDKAREKEKEQEAKKTAIKAAKEAAAQAKENNAPVQKSLFEID